MVKKPDSETAVVPATRPGPLSPSRQPVENGQRMTSSYNPALPEERKLALRAALNQDARAEDALVETLHVVHWVTLDAMMIDPDTGERLINAQSFQIDAGRIDGEGPRGRAQVEGAGAGAADEGDRRRGGRGHCIARQ